VTTGLQTAHLGLVALLERWRDQLSPREFVVLCDLLTHWLERERNKRALRRWAE
jgi:hypothetical protein